MMNQGSESTTILDPNSMKGADSNQIHHSWSSSTGSVTSAGNSYVMNNLQHENTTPANHSHQYNTHNSTIAAQSGVSSVSQASISNYAAPNVSQQYANYPSYPSSTEPYSYTNTQNQSCYTYQQPSVTDPSSQQAGNIQNSGTPYQSYQNPGSYVAPPSYSNVSYSSGVNQTSTHANQNSYWNGGNYGSYPQQYSTYPSTVDNSNQVTSYTASNSIHYPQYNQWSYYYPPAPNVSCAPGTENTQATSGTPTYPVPAAGVYSYPTNQPPPPGTTSWRNESVSTESSFLQDKINATQYNPYNYSAAPATAPVPASQTSQINHLPLYFQTPTNLSPTPHVKFENQQMNMQNLPPTSQPTSANHAPQNFQLPAQQMEANRVSKIHIPTNPKIATNLASGIPKEDKNKSTTNATSKPAYISIQVPTPSNEVSSHDDTGATTKASLPPSFRTYVERTFARCKDDSQRAANQKHLKEVITKGSTDGTLFTKNWDIEPLFPLLNSMIDEASRNVQTPIKMQTRRTKSRWEPITEDKFAEKLAAANYDMTKSAGKMDDSKQTGANDIVWNGLKSLSTQQQTPSSKIVYRPEKRPRFNGVINATENGEASNGSDKEQSLAKYFASANALADSPEEKRRREHRSKRFERAHQSEIKPYRPKISENKFTRMSRGTPLFKNFEINETRAVEDIDWDAHTVRGTCQEVEKRYLRLTSAPDPATVRPEEILEQALLMVQASQKNYLYKCDQLKSIRQDLTVQRIHNELTVKVYETHARLALEAGDLPEYNQCQSQLKSLYAEGISGCQTEFSAYNMLCITLHSNNKRDLLSAMARLSIEAKKDDAIKHAFAVRSAVSSGNYIRFFRLYKSAPNLNTSLMDLYVEKMRYNAIKCICKSYRPTIPVSYISHNLGFSGEPQAIDGEDKGSSGLDECGEWLKAHGAILAVDNTGELQVDTKATGPCLYMPEPDDAVAHGDANLAVNDFLTRATS